MSIRLSAKGPKDLAAAAPIILGFEPENSVVMMCFDGATNFHARLDLPSEQWLTEAAQSLLAPALRHRVQRVAFLYYTEDGEGTNAKFAVLLHSLFTQAGIDVLEHIRVHDNRVWSQSPSSGIPAEGAPLDRAHHFKAKAVSEGHVVLGGRSDLAARITAVPELVERFGPFHGSAVAADQSEIASLIDAGLREHNLPLADAARLVKALDDPRFLDIYMEVVDRENSADALDLMCWLAWHTPEQASLNLLPLLALTAWLRGDGALAWTAVDKAREGAPNHRLAHLVSALLEQAVPPTAWDEIKDRK